jgi:hypothetical protein
VAGSYSYNVRVYDPRGVTMPKYNNSFRSPGHIEERIVDGEGSVIGTIRVKPSSVLWKPTNARKFHSVSLKKFTDWIEDPATGAKKTAS